MPTKGVFVFWWREVEEVGGGAFEKVVILGSHCVFYFKDQKEKPTTPLAALSSRKH